MSFHPTEIIFNGAVAAYSRGETPHYVALKGFAEPRVNEDSARYEPDVGLLVADGVGDSENSAVVSNLAIEMVVRRAQQLDLRNMPLDETVEAVQKDILPRADEAIAWYKADNKLKKTGTTLGALLFARDQHLVAVGVGDTAIFALGYRLNPDTQQMEEDFGWATKEQINPDKPYAIYNALSGKGRPSPNDPDNDQVELIKPEPGDRFLIATDGILGDHAYQHIPDYHYVETLRHGDAEGIAEALAHLPLRLMQKETVLRIRNRETRKLEDVFYQPKTDDAAVGVLIAQPVMGHGGLTTGQGAF